LQDPLLCVYHRDRQLMGAAIDIAQLEAGLLAWGAEWLAIEQQLVEMAGLQRCWRASAAPLPLPGR